MQPIKDQLHAFSKTCGVSQVPLTVVRISGNDRDRFLHNFCTADIQKLPVGGVCEAFFLNNKGKTICHGYIVKRDVDLMIISTAKSASSLIENLDRYLLSEDVVIEDVSSLWRAIFVQGPESDEVLQKAEIVAPKQNESKTLGFQIVLECEIAGRGILILEPQTGEVDVYSTLTEQGAFACTTEALLLRRIEQCTPWVDSEITDANLPQEFRRDESAISFTKGCYLGQETVARLDAMGHVNQFFVGFKCVDGSPRIGDEFFREGKKVGKVTSLASHPEFENPIGLGFLRTALAKLDGPIELEGCSIVIRH